ncbi:MAG: DUF192 domain-containing protein [Actinomycetota bacterium]|nr:DUF192 domain-containing protein [Actinomycetota bacterium]
MTTTLAANGGLIATNVRWASSPPARMRGLIGRPRLGPLDALVLVGARQVHTFGLPYHVDIAFCDHDWFALHVIRSLAPRRLSRWVPRARYAIEMAAGGLAPVRPGDALLLRSP